ncbi:MAG: hypothetical protein Ct9H300mP14_00230 [Gammaproteobacteria bacterium]|nr:MAG: hypothetical protein Ct9H300mP14_00230 [Gammaproteobacteria bacterium]
MKIIEELEEIGIDATVVGREKNIYSVYRKMQDRRVPMAEMGDIFAIRIIVNTVDECYRVLGIIHNLYKPVPGMFKDYIAIPKANGYKVTAHTVVWHFWAQRVSKYRSEPPTCTGLQSRASPHTGVTSLMAVKRHRR